MTYKNFKDLPGKIASNEELCNKVFNIAKKPIHVELLQCFMNFVINSLRAVLVTGKLFQTTVLRT